MLFCSKRTLLFSFHFSFDPSGLSSFNFQTDQQQDVTQPEVEAGVRETEIPAAAPVEV